VDVKTGEEPLPDTSYSQLTTDTAIAWHLQA